MSTEQVTKRKRRRSEKNAATYDDETVEFIQAIDIYRRRSGRSFPPWSEVLEIVRALGYRKVDACHDTVEQAIVHALAGPVQEPLAEVSPMDEDG